MDVDINLNILVMMGLLLGLNLIVGILKYSDSSNTMNNSAGMIIFTILAVFYCRPGYIDKEKLFNTCLVVGVMATLFIAIQYIAFYSFNFVIKGNIPFLSPVEMRFESIEYGRPTSFFYEPAHYIIYVAPLYAMAIIRKNYLIAAIIFAGILLSTSSTGIALLLIVPVIILLRKSKSFIYVLFFLGAILLIFNFLPENYNVYLDKFTLKSLMSNIRLFGTLDLFQYFSLSDCFFGVGLNRMVDFLNLHRAGYSRNYANSLIFAVFSFGIVGLVIFLNQCRIMYRDILPDYKVMWFIFLFILVSDQILFNRNLLYLLIWIYAVTENVEQEVYDLESESVGGTDEG
jgi:hypothetical protein